MLQKIKNITNSAASAQNFHEKLAITMKANLTNNCVASDLMNSLLISSPDGISSRKSSITSNNSKIFPSYCDYAPKNRKTTSKTNLNQPRVKGICMGSSNRP